MVYFSHGIVCLHWYAGYEDLSFFAGLAAGKGGFELPHALAMLCQEMHEAWQSGNATDRLVVTA